MTHSRKKSKKRPSWFSKKRVNFSVFKVDKSENEGSINVKIFSNKFSSDQSRSLLEQKLSSIKNAHDLSS